MWRSSLETQDQKEWDMFGVDGRLINRIINEEMEGMRLRGRSRRRCRGDHCETYQRKEKM